MMTKIAFLAAALLSHAALFAQTSWKSDKMHSKLTFSITHLGISDVTGLFKNFETTISGSKADFSDGVFELTAEASSIDTEVEPRDNHLKSAEFFDVATYPNLTFKSTSITKGTSKDHYTLTGNLTIHGVTKPVSMNLWYRGTTANPMSKATTAGFQLTGTINRADFGIGPKYPPPMLSNEVAIKADGEFVKQ
jgi:polyisoprenoid-binding protein YceI